MSQQVYQHKCNGLTEGEERKMNRKNIFRNHGRKLQIFDLKMTKYQRSSINTELNKHKEVNT